MPFSPRLAFVLVLLPVTSAMAQDKPAAKTDPPPTHANVQYGPHKRNVMDVWLAEPRTSVSGAKPTPVLVSIHGGGFQKGDKHVENGLLKPCLDAGISVIAITYRLSDEAMAPAQFYDAARAIQFIRSKAKEWNLDPKRMAATGSSAGAGLSLWLGFHDDLADPNNADPVLRESTRLTCMAVNNGQTSYDPRVIRKLLPATPPHNIDTYKVEALAKLYQYDPEKLDELPPEKYKLFESVSSINFLTKDDPPVLLTYQHKLDTPISTQGIGIHHPRFGMTLKEQMDKLGIECTVVEGVKRGEPGYVNPTTDFFKRHLGVTP